MDRAPVEVALALLTAVAFSYGVENNTTWDEVFHLAVATAIAGCFAWSATLTHALGAIDTRTRWILTGAGAALAAVYLLLTPDFHLESEMWRAFMLVSAVVLFTFSAPALVRSADDENLRLRRINARLFLRGAGISLYGLALFAGLALALAAIENLFELKLDKEIYAHVFFWIMLVLVPWVIVGGLAGYVRSLDQQSEVARVVYRLATWLVPPLVAIYLVILYVYAARIIVTGELPKNLVSPMVIAAGLLSLLALVLFDPPVEGSGTRWLRYPPLLILPLAPLGFWALFMRFDDYGWTEFRLLRMVALVAVLLLAVVMAARVIRRRPFPLRAIPGALAVALLLSAVGPWNVMAVSRRDQQKRLVSALTESGVDVRATPNPQDTVKRGVPSSQYNQIVDLSSYLHSHFGAEAVTAVVPAYQEAGPEHFDLAMYFGLRSMFSDSVGRNMFARFGGDQPAELTGGQAYRVEIPVGDARQPRAWTGGDSLYIQVGADTLRVDFAPAFAFTQDVARPRANPNQDMKALPVLDGSGSRRGDLILLEVNLTEAKGKRGFPRIDAILMVNR